MSIDSWESFKNFSGWVTAGGVVAVKYRNRRLELESR